MSSYPYLFSIIIPAYNEEKRITKSLQTITEKLHNISHEIIVVDDGSTDQTPKIVSSFNLKNISCITLSKNMGKGYALKEGFLKAQGQHVVMTDADLSTPIETLFELEEEMKQNDIVIGSRLLSHSPQIIHGPFSRKLLRTFSQVLRKILFNIDIKDTQCGFKIFKLESAQKIAQKLTADRYGADLEKIIIAQKLGYTIKEVPVPWIFDQENSKIHLVRDSFKTFLEWLKIKKNILAGKY